MEQILDHPPVLETRIVEEMSSANDTDQSQLTADSDDDEAFSYNIGTAVYAWNQITSLTHEITSSVMAKQASILCKRCRRQEDLFTEEREQKKRRMERSPEGQKLQPMQSHVHLESPRAVTSDEESHSGPEEHGLPEELSSEVERMGRMSRLIMQIEFCQAQLKREMEAMNDDF